MESKDNHLHARTSELVARLKQINHRIAGVAVSVCGNVPESATDMPKAIDEHLHDKFNTANRLLSCIEDEVLRLENSIGRNQSIQGQAKAAVGF